MLCLLLINGVEGVLERVLGGRLLNRLTLASEVFLRLSQVEEVLFLAMHLLLFVLEPVFEFDASFLGTPHFFHERTDLVGVF